MLDKHTIRKITRDIFRRTNGLTDHRLMHPEREWFWGVVGALVTLSGGLCLTWQTHNHYSSIPLNETVTALTTNTVYRKAEVNDALAIWAQRIEQYEEIRSALEIKPIPAAANASSTTDNAEVLITPPAATTTPPIIEVASSTSE
jgi:hypothetical protein